MNPGHALALWLTAAATVVLVGAAVVTTAYNSDASPPAGAAEASIVGDWIHGELVDLRVVNGTQVDAARNSWQWTIQAKFHNGSREVIARVEFAGGHGALVPWSAENVTEVTTRPNNYARPNHHVPIKGYVHEVTSRTTNGYTSVEVDPHLFRWETIPPDYPVTRQ